MSTPYTPFGKLCTPRGSSSLQSNFRIHPRCGNGLEEAVYFNCEKHVLSVRDTTGPRDWHATIHHPGQRAELSPASFGNGEVAAH